MSAIVIYLILVGIVALIVSVIVAPLESLSWWSGWLGPTDLSPTPAAQSCTEDEAETEPPCCYIIFLSGIGSISGDDLLPQEAEFLHRLGRALPDARIVADVFPYAPSGRPLLTGQRLFTWLWRRVHRWRLSGSLILPALLQLRNMFQVMVSADNRYGPLYSYGLSCLIRDRLDAHGRATNSTVPVILLGSSGGAQIAVGSATYLCAGLQAPIFIVTIGGVMASDRGLAEVKHLRSLYGSKDGVYGFGQLAFPGRWPASFGSYWNLGLRDNRIEEVEIGHMKHAGRGGYLDPLAGSGGDESNLSATVGAVRDAVRAFLKPTESN